MELLQEERSLRTGALRIVADSVHHVLDVLTAFRERHPGIQVSIAQGNTGSIVETLIGYDAEIGVLGELGDERPFEVLPLNVSPIIAFAAKGHPAAGRPALSLQELASWPLVMRERGSRTRQLLEQRAGTMSGGEQQMLAIGRALMSKPRLLLLDEPSLGLAPIVIQQIFDTIEQLRQKGMTIFLVEQNANQALKLADRGYVLENGRVVLQDTGEALLANPAVRQAYLGG